MVIWRWAYCQSCQTRVFCETNCGEKIVQPATLGRNGNVPQQHTTILKMVACRHTYIYITRKCAYKYVYTYTRSGSYGIKLWIWTYIYIYIYVQYILYIYIFIVTFLYMYIFIYLCKYIYIYIIRIGVCVKLPGSPNRSGRRQRRPTGGTRGSQESDWGFST